MQEAIVITEQPVSVSVPLGYSFMLRCRAEGQTSLQYQWFCQHQSVCRQIPGATKQDLPITAQQSQLYTCRINDLYKNSIFSDWVKVEVHHCVARGLPPRLWQGEPVIILNPTEQQVEMGKPLQLQCAAMGVPAPSYQWYQNGNLLEHQKKKKLWISHAKVSDSGTYLCCASNSRGEHWTNAVDIHIVREWASHLRKHGSPGRAGVSSADLLMGSSSSMLLSFLWPAPSPSFASQLLKISHIRQDSIHPSEITRPMSLRLAIRPEECCLCGCLCCMIQLCIAGGCWSRFQACGSWHWVAGYRLIISSSFPGTCHSEKFFATGKIALLVGNNHYQHHPNLMAPVTDVFELSLLLEQLGFQVVSLLDLNKTEMEAAVSRFLELLGKGVYAIFYYAGHGYEHLGRNYMVPVDAPQPYAPENCISVQRILQRMQQQQTALNLILLDTCRKWYNSECALSQVQPLEPWGNTVYGYATSEDAEAYELQDGEFSSGIFMKYLKKHILQEKKVTHMLEDVLEDIGQDPLVTGKQVMEIKHTLKEARSLTDPICPLGAGAKRWGHGHELLSRLVTFPCGARVELRFHRLFSNLIYVCAKLQHSPAHIADTRLLLCQPTEMDSVAIPKESHWDQVKSLLTSVYKWEELDCVFQLYGLQKIQTDVVLQLDLHYTQLSTKQKICESLKTTLQKSLLGQFFSQINYSQPNYRRAPACEGGVCLWDAAALSTDLKGQESMRTGFGHSLPSSNPSNSSSEPEENDESDLSELCSALLQAGPRRDYP
ncbi:mucosa-associated lymphoid tissue lymphoma translocation protein 1-like isoform X2 [Strigops habroptila]|uniref:mucosa-associated lymphoid tissue lymphoma translocation protein 1-like isoform X2 n=1 Tax=Strigops habroptila TaxID=2489341 RepID=UPI0011CFACCC|nr:mucosa-associated lymphoid tissue lymphoma translocation protein 1-like isoform X2 [Strigops habroptila]